MDLLEEYKYFYYNGLQESQTLNSKIEVSITLVTVLGTGNLFLLKNIELFDAHWYLKPWPIINFILFLTSCVLLYFAYFGYRYHYFPVKDMNDTIQATKDFYKDHEDKENLISTHCNKLFLEIYQQCAASNANENIRKHKKHRRFDTSLMVSFTVLAISIAYILYTNYIK